MAGKQVVEVRGRKEKLSEKAFTIKAIKSLRRDGYNGIHSVYSGFNAAFREYFDGDPIEATSRLAKAGDINVVPTRRGVMLYLAEEGPKALNTGAAVLSKMGL